MNEITIKDAKSISKVINKAINESVGYSSEILMWNSLHSSMKLLADLLQEVE